VDVAVLTVVPAPEVADTALTLALLLWRRRGPTETGMWSLPGSFLRERERLADAVTRTLRDKCGVEGLYPRQLAVLDDPGRDDRGWVLSVAHIDTVRPDALPDLASGGDVQLAKIRTPSTVGRGRPGSLLALPDGQRRLPFDHETIARLAADELRRRYRERPDPARFLPQPFTLLQLRRVHEAVLGHPLQKDTFRRKVGPFLRSMGAVARGDVGRPALLYRVAASARVRTR
jgi:ADP-ribose pyrophosphatase YjhB (NUDIX family)